MTSQAVTRLKVAHTTPKLPCVTEGLPPTHKEASPSDHHRSKNTAPPPHPSRLFAARKFPRHATLSIRSRVSPADCQEFEERAVESEKSISLAMESFPCDLPPQLNQHMDRSIDEETFKSYLSHWSPLRWQEYELC
ncbi:hypothetical protein MANES_07G135966v8 [Manihot esculenta]|uniref:Uncharacterized protein n=1 Tax=Manihot esculenta TaxID=3983 RepID=A0ACB7HGX2_MANES|nr:hypothetical protein MANES_07G135966v8 [Manihot esculenta]